MDTNNNESNFYQEGFGFFYIIEFHGASFLRFSHSRQKNITHQINRTVAQAGFKLKNQYVSPFHANFASNHLKLTHFFNEFRMNTTLKKNTGIYFYVPFDVAVDYAKSLTKQSELELKGTNETTILGERINFILSQIHPSLTMSHLADRLQMPLSDLISWTEGKGILSSSKEALLCSILGINIHWLKEDVEKEGYWTLLTYLNRLQIAAFNVKNQVQDLQTSDKVLPNS